MYENDKQLIAMTLEMLTSICKNLTYRIASLENNVVNMLQENSNMRNRVKELEEDNYCGDCGDCEWPDDFSGWADNEPKSCYTNEDDELDNCGDEPCRWPDNDDFDDYYEPNWKHWME